VTKSGRRLSGRDSRREHNKVDREIAAGVREERPRATMTIDEAWEIAALPNT
jgi:hypothetical protein